MPAPEPFRIILRDANGTIRAMAECTADPAVTLSTYAADGGQMSYVQAAGDGSVTLAAGQAGTMGLRADGSAFIWPWDGAFDVQLPTADPHVDGRLWNDNGTVKVSGG